MRHILCNSFAILVFCGGLCLAQNRAAASAEGVKVTSLKLDKTVVLPSDLMPFQSVAIYTKVSGFLRSIEVDRGSWVREGQLLAVITAPELKARRLEAEARLQSVTSQKIEAEARMFAAQSTRDRLKSASVTPGVVAGHDLELAEKGLDAARANVEAMNSSMKAADAAVRTVREMEAYLELRAPFEGVVTERNAHPGSLVGPSGTPVIRIEQISRLRLVVPVPEMYVGGIARGTRVAFKVAAFPDKTFEGIVQRPAHSLEVKTRSMLVELDVRNPNRLLAPGMFAEVQWPVLRREATLFVPTSALVRTSERQFVVRIRNGVAEWVDVRRGEANGNMIEVFGDVHAGDIVLRRGNDEIRQGTRIAVSVSP